MEKSDMMVAAQNLGWPVCGQASGPNSSVTLVHRVIPGAEDAIRAYLNSAAFNAGIEATRNVHFLQIFLQGVEQLVIVGRFDAPAPESFIEFYCANQNALDDLWRHCENFPQAACIDADLLMAFFQAGLQVCAFSYTAIPSVKLVELQCALDWMKKTMHYQIELAKIPKTRA